MSWRAFGAGLLGGIAALFLLVFFMGQLLIPASGVPSQVGNAGKFLQTNGAQTSWQTVAQPLSLVGTDDTTASTTSTACTDLRTITLTTNIGTSDAATALGHFTLFVPAGGSGEAITAGLRYNSQAASCSAINKPAGGASTTVEAGFLAYVTFSNQTGITGTCCGWTVSADNGTAINGRARVTNAAITTATFSCAVVLGVTTPTCTFRNGRVWRQPGA